MNCDTMRRGGAETVTRICRISVCRIKNVTSNTVLPKSVTQTIFVCRIKQFLAKKLKFLIFFSQLCRVRLVRKCLK